MLDHRKFYIDGAWVDPASPRDHEVINPATEQVTTKISLGGEVDVDRAVAAARRAFDTWGVVSVEERIALLDRIAAIYKERLNDFAKAISTEMGAPMGLSLRAQAGGTLEHFQDFRDALSNLDFDHELGPNARSERILREPIGVVAHITPWNWPMNQVTLKVIGALCAGCTMVLKPSELAPLSAMLFAQVLHDAGVPKGVFNLVNGDGPGVGAALSAHRDVDMVSFTGSTRAGIAVSKAAAETIKRVSLELGGKSPNVIFADAKVDDAVKRGALSCFSNTGQTCTAPTRMLVERSVYDRAVAIAAAAASEVVVGDPAAAETTMGPLVSAQQFDKVQRMIEIGVKEGARLVAGGLGRPPEMNAGYYVRPTVFADVNNDMTIAREEIFGPVLSIIPFEGEEEAVAIANDTPYGLSAIVHSQDSDKAKRVARRLRSGMVRINGAISADGSPFGGYKQSGNGREAGRWGIEEFLETKAVSGWL